jgi:transposase
MKRFIEGENRTQSTLFPESLEDYIAQDNAVRVVDAFVDNLDLKQLGFDRAEHVRTTISIHSLELGHRTVGAARCG